MRWEGPDNKMVSEAAASHNLPVVFLAPVNARQHRVAREIAIFVLPEQAGVKPVDGDIDSLGLSL